MSDTEQLLRIIADQLGGVLNIMNVLTELPDIRSM